MILRSMRLIGEKARGATLDTNEQTECLAELNTFMDATANEKLLCYSVHQDSFPLSSGTSSYTIGVNGTVAVTRPTKVVDPCFVRDANGYDSPVRVISAETYGRLVSKGAGNTIPQVLYYDNGFSATSTATMFVYPVPSTALTLFFSSWQQLQAFAASRRRFSCRLDISYSSRRTSRSTLPRGRCRCRLSSRRWPAMRRPRSSP
jgi:hypothetical protein